MYRFETAQFFGVPPRELYDYFSDVRNLNTFTPGFFELQLLEGEPGRPLYPGQLFRYRLKLFLIPFPWTTEIVEVGEHSFVDIQKRGPYRSFRHLHLFELTERGTLMLDRVDYELPFGPLNGLANSLVVGPLLKRIFAHRRSVARVNFGG